MCLKKREWENKENIRELGIPTSDAQVALSADDGAELVGGETAVDATVGVPGLVDFQAATDDGDSAVHYVYQSLLVPNVYLLPPKQAC